MECIKVEHLAEPVRVATSMIGTHIPLHLLIVVVVVAVVVVMVVMVILVLLYHLFW